MEAYLAQSRTTCRTCNDRTANLHSMQESVTESKTLADLLLEIAKINIKHEHAEVLPTQICVQCVSKLKDAYAFVEQAQRVNEQLLANLRQRCGDAGPTSSKRHKQLDCLQEAPIDIPSNLDEFMQIKVEMDYSSVSEYNVANEAINTVASIKEEVASCSKADPIIVNNPHCEVKNDNDLSDDDMHGEDNTSHKSNASINDDSYHSGSDVDNLPSKRRRVVQSKKLHKQKPKNSQKSKCAQKQKVAQNVDGRFGCSMCSKSFAWKKSLQRHLNEHFYEPQFECDICERKFRRKDKLREHIRTHQRPASSSSSGKAHSMRSTRRSINDLLIECAICLQQFLRPEKLRTHIIEVHLMKRSLRCCLCVAAFKRLSELREHLMLHADGCSGVNLSEAQFFRVFHPEGCADQEVKVASEITTDFLIRNLSRYYSAVDESGNELDLYDSESDSEDENESNKKQLKETYKCELCDQTFERRKHILHHQNSNHAGASLSHSCSECESRFVCLALLDQHRNRDCMNEQKQFRCTHCPARFMWKQNLQQHEQLKHIDDTEHKMSLLMPNKLKCDQCDKAFIWPKDLKRHKRIHISEDDKYECPDCERKFNRKDNMRAHLKTHGAIASIINTISTNAAKCEKGRNKSSSKLQDMDRNLCLPHGCKIIKCMICGSSHTKVSDLRTHLRTHQYVVSFAQRTESISEISKSIYPKEPPMSEQTLIARIIADVSAQHLDYFYSITNEVGYEVSIDSSETDSDSGSESDAESEEGADSTKRHCYECELCSEKFERKYKLYEHQASNHKWEDAPYVCKHCKMRFVCVDLLQRHYEQQCKNTQKRFVCKKCPMRFMWKENLKMHVLSRHSDAGDAKLSESVCTFDCEKCDRSFKRPKDLTNHMKMHRKDLELKCYWCTRKFYRKESLLLHVNQHDIPPDFYKMAACFVSATEEPNGTKHIYCKVCNLQFSSTAALRLHLVQSLSIPDSPHQNASKALGYSYSITNKLGFELDIDDSETDDGNEDRMLLKSCGAPQQYTCEICSLIFKRKFEIARHQRSVHRYETIPLKCDKCIFRTVSKDILSYHMRTQCNNEDKQFQCSHCRLKFMWEENLTRHVELLHSKDVEEETEIAEGKVFKCDHCSCKYTRKFRLKKHIRKMHLEAIDEQAEEPDSQGDQGANCESQIDPVTGRPRESAQGRSKLSKIPVTEKKIFLCAFCGRSVTSEANLIVHMRRHTGEKPFKCDFCDMAFPRSSDLQCHRRRHTGDRPHVCTICDKTFTRPNKLQSHMRIHSGERPFKCTYCGKCFKEEKHLTVHIRIHTGERPFACDVCGEHFTQNSALKSHRELRGHFEGSAESKRTSILEQFQQCLM